jgi:hypothetical protein
VTWNFLQFCFDVWYLVTAENLMPCTRCLLTPKLNAHERICLFVIAMAFPSTYDYISCNTDSHNFSLQNSLP